MYRSQNYKKPLMRYIIRDKRERGKLTFALDPRCFGFLIKNRYVIPMLLEI